MAQGSTDTWAASRDQIVSDALAKLGAIGPGDEATGKMLTHGARRLDGIVKELDAEGQFLWRISRLTTTTTASQATVTISALAFAIDDPVRYTKSGATSATVLTPMTRDEYMALPDRTIEASVPSRYYVEKTLSSGREALAMYLYPEPKSANDTVEYAAALRAKDHNTGAINPDFPSSWMNALTYRLAADLAPDYGQIGAVKVFMGLFEAQKERLINSDNERQPTFFVPFGFGSYG